MKMKVYLKYSSFGNKFVMYDFTDDIVDEVEIVLPKGAKEIETMDGLPAIELANGVICHQLYTDYHHDTYHPFIMDNSGEYSRKIYMKALFEYDKKKFKIKKALKNISELGRHLPEKPTDEQLEAWRLYEDVKEYIEDEKASLDEDESIAERIEKRSADYGEGSIYDVLLQDSRRIDAFMEIARDEGWEGDTEDEEMWIILGDSGVIQATKDAIDDAIIDIGYDSELIDHNKRAIGPEKCTEMANMCYDVMKSMGAGKKEMLTAFSSIKAQGEHLVRKNMTVSKK